MVTLGEVAAKVAQQPKPKGQKLDEKFIDRMLEYYGYSRSVAGDEDFDRAVKALCVSAGSNRGILVTGENGCGKTQYMKALWKLFITRKVWINCVNEDDLDTLECGELYQCSVFLDDFGAERFAYGDEDRVGNFICRYYDRHDPRRVLMVSTNLDGAGIDAKYGGRVFDRLREECVILPMSGGSKRKETIIK